MSITKFLKRKLRAVVVPALGACLVGYFSYHAVQGDHGLIARNHLRTEVAAARATLEQLQAERAVLEHRADLMNPDHIDADMLDEQLRAMLNLAHPDDVVLYFGRGEHPLPAR